MQLAPIVARIKTQVTPLQNRVGVAASLKAAVQDMKSSPSAWLLAPREKSTDNQTIGQINQDVEDRFSVVLAVRNVADATGAAGLAELDTLRAAVDTALLGWRPATGYDPLTYSGGQLIHASDGWLLWADEYKTNHAIRGTISG